MSNTPHELAEDFPEHAELIGSLKQSDAHFAGLAENYHTLNRQLHRVETNVEPMDDLAIVELRKKRMALKDELYAMLSGAEA